jgi:hypothetical protein
MLCVTSRKGSFFSDELLAHYQNQNLEEHPLSVVNNLFITSSIALQIIGRPV